MQRLVKVGHTFSDLLSLYSWTSVNYQDPRSGRNLYYDKQGRRGGKDCSSVKPSEIHPCSSGNLAQPLEIHIDNLAPQFPRSKLCFYKLQALDKTTRAALGRPSALVNNVRNYPLDLVICV